MEEVNDENVDEYDSVGSSEDGDEVEDLLTVEDGIRDVPVLDYVKSKPELRRMLMYSTRYVVRSTLYNHSGVQVKVDWFTRSYHRHVIDDSVAQCLVMQHGAMEIGVERRIFCFTKCRIGKWLIHCHPNERGKGPWYDWILVRRNRGGVVEDVPARVGSFFINEDDRERNLCVAVMFVGEKVPVASSVLFDIYNLQVDDPNTDEGQLGNYVCVDIRRVVKAIYAKVSSDLTKVLVARDRETWGEAFC